MKTLKFFTLLSIISLTLFSLYSFHILQDKWVVPDKYVKMKNPVQDSKENATEAKKIYSVHCKSCHGSKGLGDGTKANGLKGDLGDFTSTKFQSQTDGELFYKTKMGRDDMPSYGKKLSDEDIWLAVNFMRTLKK